MYFKVKYGLPVNAILNLSVSDVTTIDNTGTTSTLSAGSCSLLVDGNTVGINEKARMENSVSIFPNPASKNITFYSNSDNKFHYSIYDLDGRKLSTGEFVKTLKY